MSDPAHLAPGEPLLIASPESWRETCFSLPATRALAAVATKLTVLCLEDRAAFWNAAGVGEVLSHPAGAAARKIAPLLKDFPQALVWEPGPAAEACAKAGITRRFGPSGPALDKRLTDPLDLSRDPGPPDHAVNRYLVTAARLGCDPFQAPNFIPLDHSGPAHEDRLLVVPDSDYGPNHEWPLERWSELLRRLIGSGETPVVGRTAGPSRRLGERLAADLDLSAVDLILPALDEFSAHRRCLGAESSAIHLAAAAGAVCSVLFGPGDPALHRPLGRSHRWIRRKVECSPCFLGRCPLDLRCQHDLTPDEVLRQLGVLNAPA